MPARYLTTNPCEDACGTVETDRRVEGAPVYRCPGCDSEWIELGERTAPASQSVGERTAPASQSVGERTAPASQSVGERTAAHPRPAGRPGD